MLAVVLWWSPGGLLLTSRWCSRRSMREMRIVDRDLNATARFWMPGSGGSWLWVVWVLRYWVVLQLSLHLP